MHWYEPLRRAVYGFHMPFFLYLSGLVAASSGFLANGRAVFCGAARARAERLLLPFFGLGLLVLTGKLAAAKWLFVDNLPANAWAGLEGLFWHTAASPALSIWYLFVLFVLSLATLWLLDGKPERLPWLLAVSLLLYPLPVPAYLYADRVFTYAPFFLLGAMAGAAGARWNEMLDRYWIFALALLLAGLVCVALWGQGEERKAVMLPLGALSMPALHGTLRRVGFGRLRATLLFFGRYSFMIYLGNTICIGLTKGMLLRFHVLERSKFPALRPGLDGRGGAGACHGQAVRVPANAGTQPADRLAYFEKYLP